MKKITRLFSLVFLVLTASIASAATFDFIGEANQTFILGVQGEQGYTGSSYVRSVDGITLTAQGQSSLNHGQTWDAASVYLDKRWNGGNAGLGVCKVLSGSTNQCNPSSDDNVTVGERLTLDFGQKVAISQIVMSNGLHLSEFDGEFKVTIDGVDMGAYALTSLFTTVLTGQVFELWNDNDAVHATKEFYIGSMTVSAVPIPATIWLLGSVLLGLTAIRRNAKVAAV